MKKQAAKRLAFTRDTLRILTEPQLVGVGGAGVPIHTTHSMTGGCTVPTTVQETTDIIPIVQPVLH